MSVIYKQDFATALRALKHNMAVACREGWNGKGMYIKILWPGEDDYMQRPYIYMSPADGKLVPWLASQTDLLADDWIILNHEDEIGKHL